MGHSNGNTYRILVVDDDPNCLDAVDQILRREGYETIPVDAGKSAMEVIANIDIDLAIVDFDLPDTNGLNVLIQIKRIRRYLPVIIMTARSPEEVQMAVTKAGANSFIPKPINIPNFREIVKKALHFPREGNITVRRETVVIRWFRWIIHR